jgi:hypothetical protein
MCPQKANSFEILVRDAIPLPHPLLIWVTQLLAVISMKIVMRSQKLSVSA